MTAYFKLLCLILLHYVYPKGKASFKIINLILSFTLAFITGFRVPGIGWDYYSYERIYYSIPSLLDSTYFYTPDTGVEILFQLLISICKTFHLSFSFFLGLFSFITTYLLGLSVIRIKSKYYIQSISIYFCYYFLRYQFNTIRQGFCLSIILLALSYLLQDKKIKFVLLLFIGAGFHSLSLAYLVFLPFSLIKYNKKFIYFSLLISFIFYYFYSLSSIFIKLFPSNYYIKLYYDFVKSGESNKFLGIGFFVNLLFILYYTNIRKTIRNDPVIKTMVNFLFFSCICNLVSWDIAVFTERICGIFNVALIFLIPETIEYLRMKYKSVTLYFITIIIFILYLIYYLNSNAHVNHNGIYTFIPYEIRL